MNFYGLLRANRNYRRLWFGQVISEIGDHFNNIAVFSLALAHTQADPSRSGLAVTGVMLSRAIPAVIAGPIAGVVLDRLNRKHVMIASDAIRAVLALGFVLTLSTPGTWMLYAFSALLMFASPFFSAGRSSILPAITTPEEVHAANSLTQITQWTTTTIGTFSAGLTIAKFGYQWAFVFNCLSFVISGLCVLTLKTERGFRAKKLASATRARPLQEYLAGLRYMAANPLLLGIGLIGVGWASGGGAAQILFSLFGELVYHKGAAGIGIIWGCAGIGLIVGGTFAFWLGKHISFRGYKRTISICYVVHGITYVVFSLTPYFGLGCRQLRVELLTTAAAHRRRISRAGICNGRFAGLVNHDAVDDGRGHCLAALQPTHDRGMRRYPEFDYSHLLGLGQPDRPPT
jgi:MFS family permease